MYIYIHINPYTGNQFATHLVPSTIMLACFIPRSGPVVENCALKSMDKAPNGEG